MKTQVRAVSISSHDPMIQITQGLNNVFIRYDDIKKLVKKIKKERKAIRKHQP